MAYKQLKLWFDKELAEMLANKLLAANTAFDHKSFISIVEQKVVDLELKNRVECIADALKMHLPNDYNIAIEQLLSILGPENEKETGMFKEYYWIMPIAKYVEKYGLSDFKKSMKAIYEITKRNTGEYTVRTYLNVYPTETLKIMKDWSKDRNKHVRRLSSEGVRPRLPWASKLDQFIEDPTPIFPILENLKDDCSKYVQKSVANCINDVLKDNVLLGQGLVNNWVPLATKQRKWIIKHALRNLLKNKDEWALATLSKIS
ncbi:3-methyladenine DNA glycosylase [Muricauda sp. JGD-17]|uniref:3-methyladenine DNA glycosylase n=1 Tax=Flagellimonas ochracea TaxID=2696472 RepID=A0A964T9U0_9FLAO|nr:3-methyladenine DNA glycosylase [Allomuricauda ochracea]NAY90859.1 3-methyladenine DNA glycosylase [Allomuricauda ochracea]